MTLPLTGAGPGASGVALDPATTAWVAAVVGAGGTVSGGRAITVNNLIVGLKADGLWASDGILDRLWLLAAENAISASVSIVNPASTLLALNGSIAFSANNGYTGDGSTGYLNTGYNPSTASENYALDSAAIGAYILTNRTADQDYVPIGLSFGTFAYMQPLVAGAAFFDVNASHFPSASSTTARGSWIASRVVSTNAELYKNGTQLVSSGDASAAVPTDVFFIAARNDLGSPTNFSTDQIASVFISGGLDVTDAANLSARINTYMTALGINVY